MNKKIILLVLSLFVIFTSCRKDNKVYTETVLPANDTELFQSVGNTNADSVLLYLQGGPVYELGTEDLDVFTSSPNFLKVYVEQIQTLNPEIKDLDITFNQAIRENKINTEIVHKVVKYFKNKGKKVYIIGHSFGALLAADYLAVYGNEADKVAILAGRLDMPTIVWEGFRDGTIYDFPDGVTPALADPNAEGGIFKNVASRLLAAGFGMKRYTNLLANRDLTNVLYAYSTKDVPVGSLTTTEVNFLSSKNATVLEITGGNHGSMFELPYNQQIFNFLAN